MHLEVHRSEVDGSIPVRVTSVEDQGSFKIVTIALNGYTVRARLPEGHPVPEARAWVTFPPSRIKLFADERLVG